MKFTMDGGLSAYDYKAEEDEPNLDLDLKSIAGGQQALFSPLLSTPVSNAFPPVHTQRFTHDFDIILLMNWVV